MGDNITANIATEQNTEALRLKDQCFPFKEADFAGNFVEHFRVL